MPPVERKEPGRKWAIALAVLVHLIFAAVLVFGVNWQTKEVSPVVAELWNSLPSSASKSVPEPEPESEPAPLPEAKPQPKPVPKPEPKLEQPKPVKADIELKDKKKEKQKMKEKQRKEEEKKNVEAEIEKRKKEEVKQEDAKRKEQEKLKQEILKEQRTRLAAEQETLHRQQEAEAARQQMAAQATVQARLMNDAISRISSHVRRFVVMPPDVVGNPQAEFEVSLIPTGEVLNVKLSRSSGNPAYDNAVERAIRKASPLPLPTDSSLVGRFRELKLKFRPNE